MSLMLLSGLALSVAAATLPTGFVETQIGGLSSPTVMDFAPELSGLARLTEVVVILPADLPAGQDVLVSVTYHGQTSNQVRIKIK